MPQHYRLQVLCSSELHTTILRYYNWYVCGHFGNAKNLAHTFGGWNLLKYMNKLINLLFSRKLVLYWYSVECQCDGLAVSVMRLKVELYSFFSVRFHWQKGADQFYINELFAGKLWAIGLKLTFVAIWHLVSCRIYAKTKQGVNQGGNNLKPKTEKKNDVLVTRKRNAEGHVQFEPNEQIKTDWSLGPTSERKINWLKK